MIVLAIPLLLIHESAEEAMQFNLVNRTCPVCGDAGISKIFHEASINSQNLDQFAFASRKVPEYMHWRLLECQKCDVVYSDPAPDPESLLDLYAQASFDSGPEARYASRTYGRLIEPLLGRLTDRIGALDIGTGDGVFLKELMARGFTEIVGVEPSAAPIAVADALVRPLIRPMGFRTGLFSPQQFRLITCFQTIEHTSEPAILCREAYQLLKPGGIFFLVAHNRRALSARLLGMKSPIFDLEHLQLFSPASLQELLKNAGFGQIKVQSITNQYPLSYWTRLFPFPRLIKSPLSRILQRTGVGKIPLSLPVGNLAAWGVRLV